MADAATSPDKPQTPPAKASVPKAPPTEREINSPGRLTLALLLVVGTVTVAAWGGARFACNMHPPMSRPAPKLGTERLITTPKDCAIEFVQRWRSADYTGALETVTGDLVAQMTKAKADCDARANECAREREASAGRLTTAIVLKLDGFRADTRVTTQLKGVKEIYRVGLAREGLAWKAGTLTKE
jgi:hypothetical protein